MTDNDIRPVAIVTGAGRARGIGRRICSRLSQQGYAVVVHERTSDPARMTDEEVVSGWHGAQSVVDEIVAAGGSATTIAGDICETDTALRLCEAASTLGAFAVLVNNHGSAGEANSYAVHETPREVWDETVLVNLTSLHRLSAVMVPLLAESSAARRSIVHLSSTAGHRALTRYGAYCASKAAVERMTEQQALELARYAIRVNAVAPGLTPTDMIDATIARAAAASGTDVASILESAKRRIPLRRFATTDDIAAAVSFLIGPDADFITGQVLTVDGGMTLL